MTVSEEYTLRSLWGREFLEECLHDSNCMTPEGQDNFNLIVAVAIGKVLHLTGHGPKPMAAEDDFSKKQSRLAP